MTQLVRVVHQLVPFALIGLALGVVLVAALALRRRAAGRGWGRAWGTAAVDVSLLLTAVAIGVLTLPPGLEHGRVVELIPFQDIVRTLRHASASDTQVWAMVANVVMFVPVGALVPLRFPRFDGALRIVGVCAGISASIEALQFAVGSHSTATDDVMLNTAGGVTGYFLMVGVRTVLRRQRSRKRSAVA